jgi:hypothetical protein
LKEKPARIIDAWKVLGEEGLLAHVTMETKCLLTTRRLKESYDKCNHEDYAMISWVGTKSALASKTWNLDNPTFAAMFAELVAREAQIVKEESDEEEPAEVGEEEDPVKLSPKQKLEADWEMFLEHVLQALVGNNLFRMLDAIDKGEDTINFDSHVLALAVEVCRVIDLNPIGPLIEYFQHAPLVRKVYAGIRTLIDPIPGNFNACSKDDVSFMVPVDEKASNSEVHIGSHASFKSGKAIQRLFMKKGGILTGLVQVYRLHQGAAASRGPELKEFADEMSMMEATIAQYEEDMKNDAVSMAVTEVAFVEMSTKVLLLTKKYTEAEPSHREALRPGAMKAINNSLSSVLVAYLAVIDTNSADCMMFLKLAHAATKSINDVQLHQVLTELIAEVSSKSVVVELDAALAAGVHDLPTAAKFKETYLKSKDAERSPSDCEALKVVRLQVCKLVIATISVDAAANPDGVSLMDHLLELLQFFAKDLAFATLNDKKKKVPCADTTSFVKVLLNLRSNTKSCRDARSSIDSREADAARQAHSALVQHRASWLKVVEKPPKCSDKDIQSCCDDIIDLGTSLFAQPGAGAMKQIADFARRLYGQHGAAISSATCVVADVAGGLKAPNANKAWTDTLLNGATDASVIARFDETLGHKDFKGQHIDKAISVLVKVFAILALLPFPHLYSGEQRNKQGLQMIGRDAMGNFPIQSVYICWVSFCSFAKPYTTSITRNAIQKTK